MPLLPKCQQTEKCPKCKFRGLYDMCLILSNTYFEKQCPFYKVNKFNDSNINKSETSKQQPDD